MSSHAVTARPRSAARTRRADAVTASLAATLSVAVVAKFGVGGRGFVAASVVCVLVVLSRIDLEQRILPNRIVLPAAGLVCAAQLLLAPDRALEWVLAPFAAALALLLPSLVSPGGIGMGDVKLGLLLGASLGADVVTAVILAFLFVFPVAVWLLVRGGAAARKTGIPLGPFLAAGAVVALFLG